MTDSFLQTFQFPIYNILKTLGGNYYGTEKMRVHRHALY